MAIGEPIYKDYQVLGRILNGTIRAEERALLKRAQKEYDTTTPVIAIQRQLNSESSDDEDGASGPEPVQFEFAERRRITAAVVSDSSEFTGPDGFRRCINLCIDMIALCKRRERRQPRTNRSRGQPPVKTMDDPIISPKSELKEKRTGSLKYKGFQCLFYLVSIDLALYNKEHDYTSKFSLQRHTD